jgi:hypothetical protein
VLDLLREVQPPFDPGSVIRERFVPVLRAYHIRDVSGDRHAIGFVQAEFADAGIKFTPSPLTKSDLFSELLPLVNTGRVELLDQPTLRTQLLALERRAVRGGKDSVDHARGAHDDVANAAAGALVHVTGVGAKQKRQLRYSFGDGVHTPDDPHGAERRPREQRDPMLDLIARTAATAEREARADWLITRAWSGAPVDTPMLGEILGGEAYDEMPDARPAERSPTLAREPVDRGGTWGPRR